MTNASSVLERNGSLETLEDHRRVWRYAADRKAKREKKRLEVPLVRLWDGDYVLRGVASGWRELEFEFIENDVGTASLMLPLDHYLSKWVLNHKGRYKRNVHITIDKQGARWAGRMDHYKVVRKDTGDCYVEIIFLHDMEEAKHILCWANPFLRADIAQFPKMWIIFGPAKFCLLTTLFVNILRLESSMWTLPDNPLDVTEWMGPSFWPGFWRQIVKPYPLLGDNSNLTVVFSRFKPFYDVAKSVLEDAQLSLTCRRYIHEDDPHPFSDLQGELNISIVEDLASLVPLRNGCLVWDIVDRSGWGTETAFGGSLLTGLVRSVVSIASDGMTENVDVIRSDATFPGDYYIPDNNGTKPSAPWVVFEEGRFTGIKSNEYIYYEATDNSVVLGGSSMPGVNEGISTAINMAGDYLTSIINSALASAGAFGGAIDLPPLGGVMDAVAQIAYKDVFAAFNEFPSTRAVAAPMPIAGLEENATSSGDFHYYEGWAEGADKAFTVSALAAARSKFWQTRARTAHTIEVSDAAPYYVGDNGQGDFWLGDRVAVSPFGHPEPDMLFVERVNKIKYRWDADGPSGWTLDIGRREPKDPLLKAFEKIRDINSAISQLGVW
jgi:hypothetical protein